MKAWQPSDVPEHLEGIREWTEGLANVRHPIALDVDGPWPQTDADAAYTANTCHILSWAQALGQEQGFSADEDHAMPANNRLLVFRR